MGEGVESGVAQRPAAEAQPGAWEREPLLPTKLPVPRGRGRPPGGGRMKARPDDDPLASGAAGLDARRPVASSTGS